MKCFVPEISWHNRDPVYSVDFQPKRGDNEMFYRLASGGADCHVVIWHVAWINDDPEKKFASFECAADLQRHQKCVNVVRFSPSGAYLASGDDDGYIIIWKMREDIDPVELPGSDEEKDKECWIAHKVLRGHLQDVYDIAWSPDCSFLVSGSIDNTAILWDVDKKKSLGFLGDHKGFVQGVAWDPKNKYIATLSSDRNMRVFDAVKRKTIGKCFRGKLPPVLQKEKENAVIKESDNVVTENDKKTADKEDKAKDKEKLPKLFHGDTVKTFFRRLTFSPKGDILIAPCGVLDTGSKNRDVSFVFTRGSFHRPALHLPSPGQYTVAARCSPMHYQLRTSEPSVFALPYRIVYAIATRNSLVLYDTEQQLPFGYVYNIHYTGITDVTWSPDGRFLISSSSEGFCSVIAFDKDEIGVEFGKENGATTTDTPEMSEKIDNGMDITEITEKVDNGISEVECMEVDFVSQDHVLNLNVNNLKETQDHVFRTPTKIKIDEGRSLVNQSIQRVLSSDTADDEDDSMNISQCSQASELSVLLAPDEGDLISREEQARRLISPYRLPPSPVRTASPKRSPVTPKSGRRVEFITISSPKSKRKI